MIISIGGTIGSGKTTLAKMLAEKIGYRHYYIGGIRREMARKRGMTLQELNAVGEKEAWTDKEVDEYVQRLGATEDDFVIESRTAFHFIPHSLKLFLTTDERAAAERIFNDIRKNPHARNEAPDLQTVEDVLAANRQRRTSDKKRYQRYYSLDVFDPAHYDFVLDTTNLTIDTAFEKLHSFVKSNLKGRTQEH